jgi:type II secretory pathway pseudopilin PulG
MKAEKQTSPGRSQFHLRPAIRDFLASDVRSCYSANINPTDFRSPCQRAFTLLDLIAAVAIIAVLALTLLPALAKSGGRATRITCFNNKRHVQAACAMYSGDSNEYLVPNAGAGSVVGWCRGLESWAGVDANINPAFYTTNALGRYVGDIKAYKCPNDNIPSDNGQRIRSISMNSALLGDLQHMDPGEYNVLKSYNSPYRVYAKTSDLTAPTPANMWVFCDESMYSLNDGFLQMNLNTPGDYPDVPAAYDNGGNCLSFADAHVEYRKWQFRNIRFGLLDCPYRYNQTGTHWQGGGAFDLDWFWLQQRTSSL